MLSPPLGFGIPKALELSLDPSQQMYTEGHRESVLCGLCLHRHHTFRPHGNSYQHSFTAHVQTGTAEPRGLSGAGRAWPGAQCKYHEWMKERVEQVGGDKGQSSVTILQHLPHRHI